MIKEINKIEEQLLTLMQGDKRTFHNPVTDEDYIYDAIFEAYNILKNLRFKMEEETYQNDE